jgi:hypothetical protein
VVRKVTEGRFQCHHATFCRAVRENFISTAKLGTSQRTTLSLSLDLLAELHATIALDDISVDPTACIAREEHDNLRDIVWRRQALPGAR